MYSNLRVIALAVFLGLCTSYVIWGRRAPPIEIQNSVPPDTTAATVSSASSTPVQPPLPVPQPPKAPEPENHGLTALKFEPDFVDFGNVPVNDRQTKSIRISNPTGNPIAIKDLHPSCHCIALKASNPVIAPGKSETISVEFSALPNRKTEIVTGIFQTDEPNQPKVQFSVHGRVIEELSVDPSVIQFPALSKGEEKAREFLVRAVDGHPFLLKSVLGSRPEFTYKWAVAPNSNSTLYAVIVTMKGLESGPLSDTAVITTDRVRTPSIPLYVSGNVNPDLVCTPPILSASADAGRNVGPFNTTIRHTTPGTLEILDVSEASQGADQLELKHDLERIDDRTVKLTIWIVKPYPQRTPFGQFIVKTNVEKADFRIPFRVNNAAMKLNLPQGK